MANETVVTQPSAEKADVSARGQRIIERLRAGDLPQMVDWFDPGLLAKVGVRSVISATLGSYTDQRLIQASTDNASLDRLRNRYNFSGEGVNTAGESPKASEALEADRNGAVWVDYIADLGDGFEATYAMAYLLAAEELKVQGEANALPAGKLLIMGGDQVYPDATKQEYDNRLRDPYDWAFSTPVANRKLFAIPGNHDWYDGLSAFSALFCSSRDRISRGIGTQLGGWSCQQHRSYFAIKLPHNWWIWGPDIQLADNLDDSQRDYFDLMADQTSEQDNIILCLAEPSWLHKNYDNMHEISMLARKNGAKICAIIAGDWHHYSRYTSDDLGIQFITAGGGGAFAHATHGLKPSIALKWATPTGMAGPIASSADSVQFNRSEQSAIRAGGRDFTQNPQAALTGTATAEPAAVAPVPKPSTDTDAGPGGPGGTARRAKPVRKADIRSETYPCEARSIYPPKITSRLLCLKNLLLPFHNRPFTYLVGIVYFIYAWVFVASDPRQSPITASLLANIGAEMRIAGQTLDEARRQHHVLDAQFKLRIAQPSSAPGTPDAAFTDLLSRQVRDAQAVIDEKQKGFDAVKKRHEDAEALSGVATDRLSATLEAVFKDTSIGVGEKLMKAGGVVASASLGFILDHNALMKAAEQSPMFAFMLLGLWLGLVFYVESESRIVKFVVGTLHAASHIATLLIVSWFASASGMVPRFLFALFGANDDVTRVIWNIVVTLFVGGLLGGFVMGIYWTLMSTLFKMHTGDAFGALGIKDYKNFLRIKLEKDRATIYPIALDRVPGRRGWRWQLEKGEQRPSHNPLILPVKQLAPRLIEPPIAIDVRKVLP